jgi:hypothetical protein
MLILSGMLRAIMLAGLGHVLRPAASPAEVLFVSGNRGWEQGVNKRSALRLVI